MIAEHACVVLENNLPDAKLTAEDVGAVVFVHGEGDAYGIEFANGDGSTIALVTLDASEARPVAAGEIPRARRREQQIRANLGRLENLPKRKPSSKPDFGRQVSAMGLSIGGGTTAKPGEQTGCRTGDSPFFIRNQQVELNRTSPGLSFHLHLV
jgi:hypothetical protein